MFRCKDCGFTLNLQTGECACDEETLASKKKEEDKENGEVA